MKFSSWALTYLAAAHMHCRKEKIRFELARPKQKDLKPKTKKASNPKPSKPSKVVFRFIVHVCYYSQYGMQTEYLLLAGSGFVGGSD